MTSQFRFPLKPIVCAIALAISPLQYTLAAEPATAAVQKYDIAAGTLDQALSRFAAQAGIPLAIDGSLTAGKQSAGLRGSYSVEQGLQQLLAGSGLEAYRQGDGSLALRKASEASVTLAPVKVRATEESAYGHVDGYVAQRSASGTKTDTPILETPQSISVVTADEITVLKAQNLTEALGYTAGVVRGEGADRTADGLMVRGFGADTYSGSLYRDGSKYLVNAYNGQQELYGLERVEVLKGAASVLYGNAAPGGIINTVSKRPTTKALRELNVEAGSFDRKQMSGDFSDAIDSEQDWSYRLTFLARDSDTFVDYVPDDRTFIAPALKWEPNDDTSLTLLTEYQRDRTVYVYGLPAEGTIQPNVNGRIDRERFVGEPGYDKFDNTRYAIGLLFEHAFSDALQFKQSLRYLDAANEMPSVWVASVSEDQRYSGYRGAQDREDASEAITSDTSLQYRWSSGQVEHTFLGGFDFARQEHESERYNRDAPPIDLFTPVYGQPLYAPYSDYLWQIEADRYGVYLQDQMKIADKWVVLLGGRQDWVRFSEAQSPIGTPADWYADDEKNDAFTGRVGFVYLADNGLAPFISYSESYEPVSGTDRNQSRFEPTTGDQYEAGIRYQPTGMNALLSAAVYQITQQNVSVTDPVDPNFSIQQGEVRSRGVELEAKVEIDGNANLIAAYAYTDARTTESSPLTPELDGARTGGVPYNQFSLWGDYGLAAVGIPNLRVGAGVRYVGETTGVWVAGEVPDYTLVDLMASYSTGPWRLSLNGTNITDKTYVASCTYGCFYGEPRRIYGAINYHW